MKLVIEIEIPDYMAYTAGLRDSLEDLAYQTDGKIVSTKYVKDE